MRKARFVLTWTSFVQYALLAALLLMLLALTAAGYGRAVQGRAENDAARAELAYIVNKVRAADAAGCVFVRGTAAECTLVLTDKTSAGAFETRFYAQDGMLLEEYSASGAARSPEKATAIREAETFSAVLQNGLLYITTDSGSVAVALKSAGQEAENGT